MGVYYAVSNGRKLEYIEPPAMYADKWPGFIAPGNITAQLVLLAINGDWMDGDIKIENDSHGYPRWENDKWTNVTQKYLDEYYEIFYEQLPDLKEYISDKK